MITKPIKRLILDHAKEQYPKECCGILTTDNEYLACENIHPDPENHFRLDPRIVALNEGFIQAIVHSHPDRTSKMSPSDRAYMEFHNIPYIIVALPSEEIGIYAPTGYKAPLLGRSFVHGILDCYGLVVDFYERELGIKLKNYPREDKWWEDKNSEPLYEKYYEEAGFKEIEGDLQYGDLILCKVQPTEHVNHTLIYLGERENFVSEDKPCFGNNMVLHHMYGRKSVREVFGSYWATKEFKRIRYVGAK